MRIGMLAVTALVSCGALAARAEDAPKPADIAAPQVQTPIKPAEKSTPDASAPTAAEAKPEIPSEPAGARFGLQRVDGGFLRFDYQTGRLAFCSPRPDGWGCQAVPENRAALEQEVQRLRAEIAELKKQIKSADEPPRPPQPIPPPSAAPPAATPDGPPSPNAGNSGDMTFSLPGREHLSHAASVLQDAWQHFVDLIVGFKNDVLRKS